MSLVAIITARGGSKRIPRKNVKPFMGKPMVGYAIEAALKAGIFDATMVSTDDAEIAEVARRYGAEVPFMRSSLTANDFASTEDVLVEVLGDYRRLGREFDEICCIYPCVPMLDADLLRAACEKFRQAGADSLIPVVRFSFPIQRAVCVGEDGYIRYREPKNADKRSQDLETTYHDVGMFYFTKKDSLLKHHDLVPPRTVLFELPEWRVQDIDNESDWQMAEMKCRLFALGGKNA